MSLKMCNARLWAVALSQEAGMGFTPEKIIMERCPKDYEGAVFCDIKCRKEYDEDKLGKANCVICWLRMVEVPVSSVSPRYAYDINFNEPTL